MTRRTPIATAAICLILVFATGCSPNDAANESSPSDTASAAPATSSTPARPDGEPSPSIAPTFPVPTCETLIPESLIADFAKTNWTVKSEPLRIVGTEIPGGIQCAWADYDAPASDHLVIFGWAPLSQDAAATAQDNLLAGGWTKETEDSSTIITENPDFAIATDDEGYGMTYEFGDGWVKFADTKQGLVLVQWPPN